MLMQTNGIAIDFNVTYHIRIDNSSSVKKKHKKFISITWLGREMRSYQSLFVSPVIELFRFEIQIGHR